ncbi:MAG TPA: hypothetical protein VE129_16750 [Thermoanaerobaculia bacterium]|nr:hypothetical protein [Thermoanaerobaculia bacterium]
MADLSDHLVLKEGGELGGTLGPAISGKRSPEAARWSPGKTVLLDRGIGIRFEELVELFERQRIVWVEGAHLPQAVSLTPLARGTRLAR